MSGLPCTRAESVRIGKDGPGDRDRIRALALLERLRHSEAALASGGDRAEEVPGLLRELVLAVRELAGAGWIVARATHPEVAPFMALDLMPRPPSPADLDQVLAGLLQARFPVRNEPLLLAGIQRRPGWRAARQRIAAVPQAASGTVGAAGV